MITQRHPEPSPGDWLARLAPEEEGRPEPELLEEAAPARQSASPPAATRAEPPARPRRLPFFLGGILGAVLGTVLTGIAAGIGYFVLRPAPVPVPIKLAIVEKPTAPAELIVCERGTGQFPNVQTALAQAKPGSRIIVRPGRYVGALVIDQPVEIVGEGARNSIVLESDDGDTLLVKSAHATVRGLTIRSTAGGSSKSAHAVQVTEGSARFEDCDIASDTRACTCIHGATAAPRFLRCRLHDGPGGGLLVQDKAQPLFEECRFESCGVGGVVIESGGNPILVHCSLKGNSGDGLVVRDGKGCFVDCEIENNEQAGLHLLKDSAPYLRGCHVCKGKREGVRAEVGSGGILEGCHLNDNKLQGTLLLEGCKPLFIRCDFADNADVAVWAKRGQGEFVGGTLASQTGPVAVIEGDTSKLTLHGCLLRAAPKAILLIAQKGQAHLEGCTLERPSTPAKPGDKPATSAFVTVSTEGRAILRGCRLRANAGNGLLVMKGSEAEVFDCIVENQGYPALVAAGGRLLVQGGTIRKSKQDGVWVKEKGFVRISDCKILDNGYRGVDLELAENASIERCQIHGNQAGVRVIKDSTATIRDCDLTGNRDSAIQADPGAKVTRTNNKGDSALDLAPPIP